jgi:FMN reductase
MSKLEKCLLRAWPENDCVCNLAANGARLATAVGHMRPADKHSRTASFREWRRLPIVRPMKIVSLSGSPSAVSRSAALLRWCEAQLAGESHAVHSISLRDLPATELLQAQLEHPVLQAALQRVAEADAVLLATPIYKAAYSGLLKVFLDLLPQDGLRGKQVLPLATGGSLAHLLALDYGLRPVLHALGARQVLEAVFATDGQFAKHAALGYVPDAEVVARLERSLRPLLEAMPQRPAQAVAAPSC